MSLVSKVYAVKSQNLREKTLKKKAELFPRTDIFTENVYPLSHIEFMSTLASVTNLHLERKLFMVQCCLQIKISN